MSIPLSDGSVMFKGLAEALEAEAQRAKYLPMIVSRDPRERFAGLRGFYRSAWPEIEGAPRDEWAIDPYEVDWLSVFTPIERALWHDIRAIGAVLYPQYPVGRYFVDFGNPVAKVAIECDGRIHDQRAEADATRQHAIEALGWTVYRLTGRECFDTGETAEDDERTERIAVRSAGAQLMRHVARTHRIAKGRYA